MTRKPLVYIASPYAHESPAVKEQRAEAIAHITAEIIAKQDAIILFSPIAYTHPFNHIEGMEWVEWDKQFLLRCGAMLIVRLDGWEASEGIQKEIDFCHEHNIPMLSASADEVLGILLSYFGG